MVPAIGSLLIGYFCGCFLTAVIIARIFAGRDVSEIGSGNPGMANVMARLGKKAGFLVLAGDIAKTLLAILLAWAVFGRMPGAQPVLWSGFGAVLGHNYPFWRGFKGGKGVTVTCTWVILLMPVWGTACAVVGGIITLVTGYLPLGGILIPILCVPFGFFFYGPLYGTVLTISALIMVSRHLEGLRRMAQGTEKREFGRKGRKEGKIPDIPAGEPEKKQITDNKRK